LAHRHQLAPVIWPVPEFKDSLAGSKTEDLSENPPTSDFTITMNPAGMYSLYTVVRVETKYIPEFPVSQNVSNFLKKILQNFAEISCGKIRMQLIEKKMC
jgi:hypothetical protein